MNRVEQSGRDRLRDDADGRAVREPGRCRLTKERRRSRRHVKLVTTPDLESGENLGELNSHPDHVRTAVEGMLRRLLSLLPIERSYAQPSPTSGSTMEICALINRSHRPSLPAPRLPRRPD